MLLLNAEDFSDNKIELVYFPTIKRNFTAQSCKHPPGKPNNWGKENHHKEMLKPDKFKR